MKFQSQVAANTNSRGERSQLINELCISRMHDAHDAIVSKCGKVQRDACGNARDAIRSRIGAS